VLLSQCVYIYWWHNEGDSHHCAITGHSLNYHLPARLVSFPGVDLEKREINALGVSRIYDFPDELMIDRMIHHTPGLQGKYRGQWQLILLAIELQWSASRMNVCYWIDVAKLIRCAKLRKGELAIRS
jgi:hypothetical protein